MRSVFNAVDEPGEVLFAIGKAKECLDKITNYVKEEVNI
jgi:hypothetical protein